MKKTAQSLKLNAENLKRSLDEVRPALSNKDFIEIMTHFLFTEDKIIAYNDKICISYPYKKFNKTFSIKATDFLNIIKTIKDKNILYMFKKDSLLLKTKDTEAKISINTHDMKIKEMYDQLDIDNIEFIKLKDADKFKQGLKLCRYSVAKDVTNRNLYCLNVNKDCIQSADNSRASKFGIKESLNSFLIPGSAVNDLVNYPFEEISLQENWVHFRSSTGLVFSARLVDGDYPDITPFFKIPETKDIKLPSELKSILEQVAVMAEGEVETKKEVEILLADDILTCTSKKEIGYLKKKMSIDYKGEAIKFQINPFFLSQILDKIQTVKLSENVAYFVSDNFIHLIAIAN